MPALDCFMMHLNLLPLTWRIICTVWVSCFTWKIISYTRAATKTKTDLSQSNCEQLEKKVAVGRRGSRIAIEYYEQ